MTIALKILTAVAILVYFVIWFFVLFDIIETIRYRRLPFVYVKLETLTKVWLWCHIVVILILISAWAYYKVGAVIGWWGNAK